MFSLIIEISDSFCVSLIKIQAVNFIVANLTMRNLTIYSNYSLIFAENVNATLVNKTFINFTDFQIKNTKANMIFQNNYIGFLDFNRSVVGVYLKRTTFINLLMIIETNYFFMVMVSNTKDLVFVDSSMTQNISVGKMLTKISI